MIPLVVNKETGRVLFKKSEVEKKAKAQKPETKSVHIPVDRMEALATLAEKDGFEADGETRQGIMAQTTRAVTAYIVMAIDLLLEKRASEPKLLDEDEG